MSGDIIHERINIVTIIDSRIRKFVIKLAQLTNEDKLEWKDTPSNARHCQYKYWNVYVAERQYDKPFIIINDKMVEDYNCGIQDLHFAILTYYTRKEENIKKKQQLEEKRRQRIKNKILKDFLGEAKALIDDLDPR